MDSQEMLFERLPEGLPIPGDDGACNHLLGESIPSVSLLSTEGNWIDLSSRATRRTVVYCYPMTGVPGKAMPKDWDMIPGARGCTPEACSFRDYHAELQQLGAEVFGLSTQTREYQREMIDRLHVPFEVLSDSELRFATALKLPLLEVEGLKLIRRLTLILNKGVIEKVFYPVFPSDTAAETVTTWLREHPL